MIFDSVSFNVKGTPSLLGNPFEQSDTRYTCKFLVSVQKRIQEQNKKRTVCDQ